MGRRPSRTRAEAAAGALLAAVALGAAPATAGAVPATSAEVRALARAAPDDARALARLRSVDRVDGRPVDLGSALDAGRPSDLRARLDALAEAPRGAAARTDADARRDARRVLGERRFRGSSLPRPLRRPLERLGGWLDDAFDWLDERVPGGAWGVWVLLAALVVAVALATASRITRRRLGEETGAATRARDAGEDPRSLERAADDAERAGDLARAIRLRFRAGLLRLDAQGRIELRPGLTTRAVARTLRSPTFEALAATFEDVAYGGRTPKPGEVAAAREGWARLAREGGRRRDGTAGLERAA